jgi:hypothetical protein
VAVTVDQEHGPIRDDAVEVGAVRPSAREVREGPAAAQDPFDVRVGRGIGGDDVQTGVPAARVVELAAEAREAAVRRVDVRVLEPRRRGSAAELDVACAGADEAPHIAVAAHGDDPAVLHGQRLRPRLRGIGGEDATPGQDEIGVLGVRHGAESGTARGPQGGVSRGSGRRSQR